MGKTINKKILPEYFEAVKKGLKTFELRKDDDNIQPCDFLVLDEWDGERYTNEYIVKEVKYVLRNCPQYGLMDGYCIIGF